MAQWARAIRRGPFHFMEPEFFLRALKAVVEVAGFAYLGLGPRPPTASWGSMLRQAYDRTLYTASWQLFVPGAAIARQPSRITRESGGSAAGGAS